MKAPCKDCADRHYLCHSECEEYIVYTEERHLISETRAKEQMLNQLNNPSMQSSVNKCVQRCKKLRT